MDPSEYLEGTTVRVPATRHAVAQVDDITDRDAFAVVRDEHETTVVLEESRLATVDPLAAERGWRRLTFEAVLPFDLVGFLGVVASELAEAGVSVFVVSAYSTDHVFVKASDLDAAATRLEALGCVVDVGDDGA